ncbi:hypothetical protein [Nocardia sp. XZ_19_385]|uniref:hypothetical protein n=1 Tax=Nocardia sp. XZ_19_385 TaxID=2769488 RepID=UPI00188ECDE1|nr:hypothetical protein [Nocardia sp. XZ_19_385]
MSEPPDLRRPGELSGFEREQTELWDRQAMVAITLARDYVWVGLLSAFGATLA